jgi:wobble nucleotide-excising tRNase
MIDAIQLLRNIGAFDSVSAGANIPLAHLTLLYAENGRGKTTLAAILRSLASGDPLPILERRRLAAQHPPHVVLHRADGLDAAMFQNGTWDHHLPGVIVFDDTFICRNVYSGLAVEPAHRQRMHDLILGAQGVDLNEQLQSQVAIVESLIRTLRERADAIPTEARFGLLVDDFCALTSLADIDQAIRSAEMAVAATRQVDAIRAAPLFQPLYLPAFDVGALAHVLESSEQDLAVAAPEVRHQIETLGEGGEAWIASGMTRVRPGPEGGLGNCPFCAQELGGSHIYGQYARFFGRAYGELARSILGVRSDTVLVHGGDAQSEFDRAVGVLENLWRFWSQFCELPMLLVDRAAISRDWRLARDAVGAALSRKLNAPLDPAAFSNEEHDAIHAHNAHCGTVEAVNRQLDGANLAARGVQEGAHPGNAEAVSAELARLRAIKARGQPEIAELCDAYLAAKEEKVVAERRRDDIRTALDAHRATVFPAHQNSINHYLGRFNAGFRLSNVASANIRGGSTCNYDIVINNTTVPVAGGVPGPGQPSFGTTLSAGDRNALALALFFASLDQDADIANKIIVIDDPASSLDDHRTLTTVQELRRLSGVARQLIVMSHSRTFLCRLWEGASRADRAAVELARDTAGSTLRSWNVNENGLTSHDQRDDLFRRYLARDTVNRQDVAEALRPHLEAFLRVACPEHFPPESLLGPFRDICRQSLGTPNEILTAVDLAELTDLSEYASRFHHDTDRPWQTPTISDAELQGYVERTRAFTGV